MRILYIHVPCAWMGLFVYAWLSVLSLAFLVFRWPLIWPLIQESVPLGAAFTLLSLITGSIWGKPTWGTWWVWDARLTSMFVLLLMYGGIFNLSHALPRKPSSCLFVTGFVLVGSINLPIIHYSVLWWHTLHQGASVLQWGRPSIDAAMFVPLLLMAVAHMSLFGALLLYNLRTHLLAHARGCEAL